MAIHLTKIYTRTGDDGTTGLANFDRVSKNDPRLVAYADCEEANCAIGEALALIYAEKRFCISPLQLELQENDDNIQVIPLVEVLRKIQNELFDAGADLATPITPRDPSATWTPIRITDAYIRDLENDIDLFNTQLEPLNSFILPGGTLVGAKINTARVITRRAERAAWRAVDALPETTSPQPAKYLNRLSDLLFILGRIANKICAPAGSAPLEPLWVPGKR